MKLIAVGIAALVLVALAVLGSWGIGSLVLVGIGLVLVALVLGWIALTSSRSREEDPPATFSERRGHPAVAKASADLPALEDAQFTLYRPEEIDTRHWHPLLVFAHRSARPPNAPPNVLEPLEEVRRQAEQRLGERLADYRGLTHESRRPLPSGSEVTIVPSGDGLEFRPARRSFHWTEEVHREEFDLRAGSEAGSGRTLRGRMTVYLGVVIVAEIDFAARIGEPGSFASSRAMRSSSTTPYRKIFPSYSHRDVAIVSRFSAYARALGDDYMRDVERLRAGEAWSERIEALISEADIFQLFWSQNSMRSVYVRREWEYALALHRGGSFVRPTYWEEPLPRLPEAGLPPEALERLHFQRIDSALLRGLHHTTHAPVAAAEEATRGTKSKNHRDPRGHRRRTTHLAIFAAAALLPIIGLALGSVYLLESRLFAVAEPEPVPPPLAPNCRADECPIANGEESREDEPTRSTAHPNERTNEYPQPLPEMMSNRVVVDAAGVLNEFWTACRKGSLQSGSRDVFKTQADCAHFVSGADAAIATSARDLFVEAASFTHWEFPIVVRLDHPFITSADDGRILPFALGTITDRRESNFIVGMSVAPLADGRWWRGSTHALGLRFGWVVAAKDLCDSEPGDESCEIPFPPTLIAQDRLRFLDRRSSDGSDGYDFDGMEVERIDDVRLRVAPFHASHVKGPDRQWIYALPLR